MRVNFELTGATALLMHWDNIKGADTVKEWIADPANKNASNAGDDRTPAWTWITYTYHDGEHVAIPSENVMVALRQAGAQLKLKGNKTFKAVTQTGILIETEFLDFFADDDRRVSVSDLNKLRKMTFAEMEEETHLHGFQLFLKRAKVGTSKHIRVRPRFDSWRATGSLNVVAPEITFDKLKTLFELAGRVGIGDWRPGCKTPGPFGQFTVVLKKA